MWDYKVRLWNFKLYYPLFYHFTVLTYFIPRIGRWMYDKTSHLTGMLMQLLRWRGFLLRLKTYFQWGAWSLLIYLDSFSDSLVPIFYYGYVILHNMQKSAQEYNTLVHVIIYLRPVYLSLKTVFKLTDCINVTPLGVQDQREIQM